MKDRSALLHNMSAPPKSVVRYSGLADLAAVRRPGGPETAGSGFNDKCVFGTPVKFVLPDAHTDFIFAVAGEEFGLLACTFLIVLFAFVVWRALQRALEETDHFIQLGASGLAVMFGLQAVINIAVSLSLMPAKGMTLPFVSYGGSSMLALALTIGMLLALTRERFPGHRRY